MCSLAPETYTDLMSNSSAGARESRLKPKAKILPPFHSQYISQSNPFPNTRPGRESMCQCPGNHRRCMGGSFSPFPLHTFSLILVHIREKACVSSSLCCLLLTDESSRLALLKPPSSPQHTNAHSHCGQFQIASLV